MRVSRSASAFATMKNPLALMPPQARRKLTNGVFIADIKKPRRSEAYNSLFKHSERKNSRRISQIYQVIIFLQVFCITFSYSKLSSISFPLLSSCIIALCIFASIILMHHLTRSRACGIESAPLVIRIKYCAMDSIRCPYT